MAQTSSINMEFNFEDHPHQRQNILTGDWILVSLSVRVYQLENPLRNVIAE